MEIAFTLTAEDICALSRYHMDRRLTPSAGIVVALVLLVASFVLYAFLGPWDTGVVVIPVTLSLLFWFVFRHGLNRSSILRELGRKPEMAKTLLCQRRLAISPEALGHSSEFETGSILWSAIQSVVTLEEHGFFYVSPSNAIILPRRAFGNESEFRTFMQLAQGYFEKARRGKSFDATKRML